MGRPWAESCFSLVPPRTYLKGRALLAHTNTALKQSSPCRTAPRLPFQSGASQSELITAVIYSSHPRSVPGWPRLKRARFESRRGVPGQLLISAGAAPPPSTSPHPLTPRWPGTGLGASATALGTGPEPPGLSRQRQRRFAGGGGGS